MGLDTYAGKRLGEDKIELLPDSLFLKYYLVSGAFSMDQSSFRGKIYNDYVEYVTGQSLYQQVIGVDIVVKMAENLTKFALSGFNSEPGFESRNIYGVDQVIAHELAAWFQTVAKNNGVVVGWW